MNSATLITMDLIYIMPIKHRELNVGSQGHAGMPCMLFFLSILKKDVQTMYLIISNLLKWNQIWFSVSLKCIYILHTYILWNVFHCDKALILTLIHPVMDFVEWACQHAMMRHAKVNISITVKLYMILRTYVQNLGENIEK